GPGDSEGFRAHSIGKHFTQQYPHYRAPGNSERDDIKVRRNQSVYSGRMTDGRLAVRTVRSRGKNHRHRSQGEGHSDGASQQEWLASHSINQQDSWNRSQDIDQARQEIDSQG